MHCELKVCRRSILAVGRIFIRQRRSQSSTSRLYTRPCTQTRNVVGTGDWRCFLLSLAQDAAGDPTIRYVGLGGIELVWNICRLRLMGFARSKGTPRTSESDRACVSGKEEYLFPKTDWLLGTIQFFLQMELTYSSDGACRPLAICAARWSRSGKVVSAGFSLEADGCGWIATGRLFSTANSCWKTLWLSQSDWTHRMMAIMRGRLPLRFTLTVPIV